MRLPLGLWILAVGVAITASTAPAAEIPEKVQECLECHGDDSLTLELGDGTEMSVYVDAQGFLGSVHGRELFCADCHEGYDNEHPDPPEVASRRDYTLAAYTLCRKCHFDTYTRTLESVHYQHLKEGSREVPVCTDCHGSHAIADPRDKADMVSKSCGACHAKVYTEYAKSVHGAALSTANRDVPACADCHMAHRIESPDTAGFHVSSPQICIRCHGDSEVMSRYGLPTTVATTYLADFHGVTASLTKSDDAEQGRVVVVCVDCHGHHGIESTSRVGSEAMKERVAKVCSGCHQGASPDFPAAWLSHYPPSWNHAPLVWLVMIFYRFFIPFMVVGLVLQVLLHLYRVGIRR